MKNNTILSEIFKSLLFYFSILCAQRISSGVILRSRACITFLSRHLHVEIGQEINKQRRRISDDFLEKEVKSMTVSSDNVTLLHKGWTLLRRTMQIKHCDSFVSRRRQVMDNTGRTTFTARSIPLLYLCCCKT